MILESNTQIFKLHDIPTEPVVVKKVRRKNRNAGKTEISIVFEESLTHDEIDQLSNDVKHALIQKYADQIEHEVIVESDVFDFVECAFVIPSQRKSKKLKGKPRKKREAKEENLGRRRNGTVEFFFNGEWRTNEYITSLDQGDIKNVKAGQRHRVL